MKQTPNLLLKLPDPTDYVLIGDLNENFTKIDEEVAKINDEETGVQAQFIAHKEDNIRHLNYVIASGTNTYTATIPGVKALVEGISIKVKFANANTGTSTLNINGLGAKSIRKGNGNTLSGGNIKVGQILHLVYTGSNFQVLGEGGEYGNVTPEDVVLGKIFGTENGLMTGIATIQSLGGKRIASGQTEYINFAKPLYTGAGKQYESRYAVVLSNIGFRPNVIFVLCRPTSTSANTPFALYQNLNPKPQLFATYPHVFAGEVNRGANEYSLGGQVYTFDSGSDFSVGDGNAILPLTNNVATYGGNVVNWFAIG